MKGIKLTKKEGAMKESIIKLNYIFTISEEMVERFLFKVPKSKKEVIKKELLNKFE